MIIEFTGLEVYRFEEGLHKSSQAAQFVVITTCIVPDRFVSAITSSCNHGDINKGDAVTHQEEVTVATACENVNGVTLKRKQ